MSHHKPKVPAVDGWFTMDEENPRLLGTRCASCGSYFFPKESSYCRNPGCAGTQFDETPLSATGKLWSYTTNHYKAPEPYVNPDPFVPYSVTAVELAKEKMVVLGQLASGVDPATLKVGMDMKLVLEVLYEDATSEHVVWKWKPVA